MVQITGRPQKPKQESILRSDSFCLQDMFTKKIKIRGKRGRTEVKSKHITKESLNLDEKAGRYSAAGHPFGFFILPHPSVSLALHL